MADGYPSSHPDFTAWSGDEPDPYAFEVRPDDPDPYGDWYEQDPYGEGPVEDEPEPDEDEEIAG